MPGKQNVRYRSVLTPSPRVRLVLRAILLLGVVLSALLWLTQSGQLLAFSRGIVTVDDDALRLTAFPVFRKTVPLAGIESVKVAAVDPVRDYRGLGYRVARNGEVGFAYDKGPAVQVWMRDERVYVVADPDAEALAGVLRTATERN